MNAIPPRFPQAHRYTDRQDKSLLAKLITFFFLACATLNGSLALATNIHHVMNLDDSGSDSLRQKISASSDGDVIVFDVTGTITLSSELPPISKSISIHGPGALHLAISGNDSTRIFHILPGASVNISGLAMIHGRNSTPERTGHREESIFGGAVLNEGNLALRDCALRDNAAVGPPYFGYWAAGGAVASSGGFLTLVRCELSENSAVGSNNVNNQPGGAVGGAVWGLGAAESCTFSGNTANGGSDLISGAPFVAYGGAAYGKFFLSHCTLSGNFAVGSGEQIYRIGDNNFRIGPTAGGGASGSDIEIVNCIISGNTSSTGVGPDIDADWSFDQGSSNAKSAGGNVIGILDSSHLRDPQPSDVWGTKQAPFNPELGPLRYNGGETRAMAVQSDSAAIDRGIRYIPPVGQDPLGLRHLSYLDQRLIEPYDVPGVDNSHSPNSDNSDSGAYEYSPVPRLIPSIYLGPASLILTPGGAADMSAGSTNADAFQWQFNGTNISGATNAAYSFTNVQPSSVGDYTLVLSNSYGSVTSPPASLTIVCLLNVSTNIAGSGVIIRSPNQSSYLLNSNVTLTAVPASNYVFQSWAGGISSSNNPVTIAMTNNRAISANFVFNTNAPVIGQIPDQTITEGTALAFTVVSHLPGSSHVAYGLDASAPTNATINAVTGNFFWVPAEDQGPGEYDIIVRATTTNSPILSTLQSFHVTVLESNMPPTLAPIGNKTVAAQTSLSFALLATDLDLPANQLSFSLDAGAPTNASMDPITGVFSWTPSLAQAPGVYLITARVSDWSFLDPKGGLTATQTFLVTVILPLTNTWSSPISGKWETASNWSAGPPSVVQSLLITNAGNNTVTIDSTTSGSFSNTMTVTNLTLGASPGFSNALQLMSAGLGTPLHVVRSMGLMGGGILKVDNSALQVDDGLDLGVSGGAATFTLNSGTAQLGGYINVGGGNSQGTLNLNGGTLSIPGVLVCGAGNSGTGIVNIAGGTLITTNNTIQCANHGTGRFTVSNGLVQAKAMELGGVGGSQNSSLTVQGGMMTLSESLRVGDPFSTPALSVGGGLLAVTNASHNAMVILENGSVLQSGGTLIVDTLILTNASGHFNRVGGTFIYHQLILDPNLDPDGDGYSNAAEAAAGTDPLDAASFPSPRLSITCSGANVIVSWPSPSTGFVLQESSDLRALNWNAVAQTPTDDGTTKRITLPVEPGGKFYRLKK